MNKVKIGLLTSLAIIIVGIGSYFTYQNIHKNKNDKIEKNSSSIVEKDNTTNEIPQNSTEYENIELKSYQKEENVTQPISNSKAPIGQPVFKPFNIKENEPKIIYDEWEETETVNNEKIYYKKIADYLEYEKLMKNYSNLRPLEENDFKEYFAVVILNENVKERFRYKYLTYTKNEENDILNINMTFEENEEKDILYSGLVVIMTNWHLDYDILPEIQQ